MRLQSIVLTGLMCAAMTGCNRDSGVSEMKPSRAAQSGCQWVEGGDSALGVKFLIEDCGGKRPAVARKANLIEIGTSGARIEVYGKHFAQPAVAAIKEQFLSRLSPKELALCIVKPRPEGVQIPQAMQAFTIIPGPDYEAEAKAKRDADPNAQVCGDHGQGPVQGFFLAEQGTSGGRLAYVSAGSGNTGFDQMSVRFETDKAMAGRLESLAPENLATAELLAFTIESDLKRFKESRGQLTEGETESSFVLFSKDGTPVVLVGQFKVSDRTDGAVRAYFNDGRLFLIRENLLATPGGAARSQIVIWKRLAFDANGTVIESRKVVDGGAAQLLPGEVEESVKAVNAMIARSKR